MSSFFNAANLSRCDLSIVLCVVLASCSTIWGKRRSLSRQSFCTQPWSYWHCRYCTLQYCELQLGILATATLSSCNQSMHSYKNGKNISFHKHKCSRSCLCWHSGTWFFLDAFFIFDAVFHFLGFAVMWANIVDTFIGVIAGVVCWLARCLLVAGSVASIISLYFKWQRLNY